MLGENETNLSFRTLQSFDGMLADL